MSLILTFQGDPKAVQSFRFTKQGRRYQPKEVGDWKNYVKLQAQSQLSESYKLLSGPVKIKADFVFSIPKSFPKYKHNEIAQGIIHYKITKPDLTDNLMKGLIDALSGIAWEQDQQICIVESRKIYGVKAYTRLNISEVKPHQDNSQPNLDFSF